MIFKLVPDKSQHLRRAEDNEWLAGTFDFDEPLEVDWAVTILFYSALHYIDSFLAGKNFHPMDHETRDSEVENNGTLHPIFEDYRRLKDASRAARYDIANYNKSQYPQFEARFKRIKVHILASVR